MSRAYNDRGEAYSSIDPAGREDRTLLDDAGREIETRENYIVLAGGEEPRSDQNRTARKSYTSDGALATLRAVNPSTGDQVTRYIYGTTLAESFVARSDLLRAEIYPDSDDTDYLGDGLDKTYDRIEYTYNRQAERKSRKDQNGTVRGFTYDGLGRPTHDFVETLAPGVDGRVRRISRTYNDQGQVEKLTSYTLPMVGTGGVLNEVSTVYNSLALPVTEYQSHHGAVDTSSTLNVTYGYDDTQSGGEFTKGLRRTSMTYPNGRMVHYNYSSADGNALNRLSSQVDDDNGTPGDALAEYAYLGEDQIVQVDYPEPNVRYDLTHGTSDDPYHGPFDRFG